MHKGHDHIVVERVGGGQGAGYWKLVGAGACVTKSIGGNPHLSLIDHDSTTSLTERRLRRNQDQFRTHGKGRVQDVR